MSDQIVHQPPQPAVLKPLYDEDELSERAVRFPESIEKHEIVRLGMIAKRQWVASVHAAEADIAEREKALAEYKRVIAIWRKVKLVLLTLLFGAGMLAAFGLATGAIFNSCTGDDKPASSSVVEP
jgi:hypothetical protein